MGRALNTFDVPASLDFLPDFHGSLGIGDIASPSVIVTVLGKVVLHPGFSMNTI